MDLYTVIIVGLAISAIHETSVSIAIAVSKKEMPERSLRSPTGLGAAPRLNAAARLS